MTERMAALAILSLVDEGLIEQIRNERDHGELYSSYTLSDSGTRYLLRSYSSLMQQERNRIRSPVSLSRPSGFADDLADHVPF